TATYTPTEAEIAAGTVQLTFTTTGQATPCAAATKNVTATINANPEAPEVEYIGPSCTETNFRVKVTSPVAGTYTLRQMKGGVAPMSRKYPEDAVDGKIIFEGLTIGKGYSVTHTANSCTSEPEKCGDFSGGYQEAEQVSAGQARVTDQEVVLRRVQKANVSAAPNPFNDRIRFTLKSDVSGQGTLELYNTLGQKVKTVFQGQVNAGQVQTIEYAVPSAQRTNLIYLFRVGDQTTTGKLVGLKQ
ncbi:T9SS type A sorting domain-containing protein, partial [Flavisolibacter sp. BT320]|nr:T9SS type A sorting domain-containing protein [Flavisolibacter longurius]